MKVELLYFDDCPNHELAEQRLREVMKEVGIRAAIVRIPILDEATANEMRFLGSPTIRVDDQDVVPANGGGGYGPRCRLYTGDAGLEGAPSKSSIRLALQRSGA